MKIFGETLPPLGHMGFCKRHPEDCRRLPAYAEGERIALTAQRRREMQAINDLVNERVRPATDKEIYGRVEHWEYPETSGDCEDYVLLKQRLLIERGWPQASLLITVVRDENDEGHAILTARTSEGDFVLDNKVTEIMAWNVSRYTFVKRQSYRDPMMWMSLAPVTDPRTARLSGTKTNNSEVTTPNR